MKRVSYRHVWMIMLCLVLAGCVAKTPVVPVEASLPPTPLSELIARVDQYKGKSVVMGGYVVEVTNEKDRSRILAVESPLGKDQKPMSKDLSEGRVVFLYNGFIDPEVYKNGRKITVAGEITAAYPGDATAPYPALEVQIKNLYLWPLERAYREYPVWEDPWVYSYYPWWYGYSTYYYSRYGYRHSHRQVR